jgi:hypothetical protein
MKKMRMAEMATPESIAAESTSEVKNHQNQAMKGGGKGERLTVALGPPREMTPADDVLEDEANDAPGDMVDRVRQGDVARAGKDDREVEVPDPALFDKSHPITRHMNPWRKKNDSA